MKKNIIILLICILTSSCASIDVPAMTDLYRSNDPDYDYEIRIKHVPLAIYDANTEEGRYKTVKHLLKDECKDVSVLVVDRVKGRSPVGINVDVHFTKVKCLN